MSIVVMLMAALAGQAAPTQPAGLAPSGKWVADFADAQCTLSRSFGEGNATVTLALRSTPGNPIISLYLLRAAGKGAHERVGDGEVVLEPSGRHATPHFEERLTPDGGQRAAELFVQREDLSDLAASKAISIRVASDAPVRVRLDNIAAALRTQASCEDQLARHWGFDPAALRAQSKPPVPHGPQNRITGPQNWITDDDYPVEAVRQRWQGTVAFRLTVGADGTVRDCVVSQSSGQQLLDSTACMLFKRRGKFDPALDKDGVPTASLWTSRFTWRLP